MTKYLMLLPVALSCCFVHAADKKLFSISAESVGQTAFADFNTAEDAALIFGDTSLARLLPGYDDGSGASGMASASPVQFLLDFRGLPMQLSYAQGSSVLQLAIPELGIQQSFDGGSRRASADLFYDWFKNNPQGDVNRIMERLAAVSEVDVLAGNPASLMAQMIDDGADASLFIDNRLSDEHAEQAKENQIGVGVEYSQLQTDRGAVTKIKMPLSYTVRFDHKPGMQLDLRLPVSYQEVQGAKSYSLPGTAVLRYPVSDNWTVSPALGYGIAGSEALGSGGTMYSALLTSSYVFRFDGYDLTMGNMVGTLKTQKVEIGDYSFEPKLSNQVLRNGLLLTKPVAWFGGKNNLEIFWVNTKMTGSDLLVDSYNVVGLSFGPGRSKTGEENTYNYGFKYLFSNEMNGFSFDVNYWF